MALPRFHVCSKFPKKRPRIWYSGSGRLSRRSPHVTPNGFCSTTIGFFFTLALKSFFNIYSFASRQKHHEVSTGIQGRSQSTDKRICGKLSRAQWRNLSVARRIRQQGGMRTMRDAQCAPHHCNIRPLYPRVKSKAPI